MKEKGSSRMFKTLLITVFLISTIFVTGKWFKIF